MISIEQAISEDHFHLKPTLIERLSQIPSCWDEVEYFKAKLANLQTVELEPSLFSELVNKRADTLALSYDKDDREAALELIKFTLPQELVKSGESRIYHIDLAIWADLLARELKNPRVTEWTQKGKLLPLADRKINEFLESDPNDNKSPFYHAESYLFEERPSTLQQHIVSILVNGPTAGSSGALLEGIIRLSSEKNPNDIILSKSEEVWRPDEKKISDFLIQYLRSGRENLDFHFMYVPRVNRTGFSKLENEMIDFLKNRKYRDTPTFDWIWGQLCGMTPDSKGKVENGKTYVRDDSQAIAEALSPDNKATAPYREYMSNKIKNIHTIFTPMEVIRKLAAHFGKDENYFLDERTDSLADRTTMKPVLNMQKVLDELSLRYSGNRIDDRIELSGKDSRVTILNYEVKTEEPTPRTYVVAQFYIHRKSQSFDKEKVQAMLVVYNKDNPDNRVMFKIDELYREADQNVFLWEYYIHGKTLEYHIHIVDQKNRDSILDMPAKMRNTLAQPDNMYSTAMLYNEVLKETMKP